MTHLLAARLTFLAPSAWFLLLLFVLPLLWWRWTRRPAPAMPFPDISELADVPRSLVVRLRWIIPALRSLAIAALVICLARPLLANQSTRIMSDGIAIEIVVDRSTSMYAQDFRIGGTPVDRLDAVKSVVRKFVLGVDEGDEGRVDDLIGLITFAGFADSNCPMTFDHEHMTKTLAGIQIADPLIGDDGTAIGDALALAVERLADLETRLDMRKNQSIRSKVIILLTDGVHNAGEIDPITAAELAIAFGIRVYTIGAGTTGTAMVPALSSRTGQVLLNPDGSPRLMRTSVQIDEETLREIARLTDGAYFRATDTDSLLDIYEQIDALEESEIVERRSLQYTDLAVEPTRVFGLSLPPLLLVAFLALLLETTLAATRFRTSP